MSKVLRYLFVLSLSLMTWSAPATQATQEQLLATCLVDLLNALQQGRPAPAKAIPPYLRANMQPNEISEQFIISIAEQIENFWRSHLNQRGLPFQEVAISFFNETIQTGCGEITRDHGFVYCPKDASMYIDLNYYSVHRKIFGELSGAYFAYVIAHEFGHHLQNVLGIRYKLFEVLPGDPATRLSAYQRKLEDQADCLSGVFVSHLWHTQQIKQTELDRIVNEIARTSAMGQFIFGLFDGSAKNNPVGALIEMLTDTHGLGQNRLNSFNTGLYYRDPNYCKLDAGIADFAYYPYAEEAYKASLLKTPPSSVLH